MAQPALQAGDVIPMPKLHAVRMTSPTSAAAQASASSPLKGLLSKVLTKKGQSLAGQDDESMYGFCYTPGWPLNKVALPVITTFQTSFQWEDTVGRCSSKQISTPGHSASTEVLHSTGGWGQTKSSLFLGTGSNFMDMECPPLFEVEASTAQVEADGEWSWIISTYGKDDDVVYVKRPRKKRASDSDAVLVAGLAQRAMLDKEDLVLSPTARGTDAIDKAARAQNSPTVAGRGHKSQQSSPKPSEQDKVPNLGPSIPQDADDNNNNNETPLSPNSASSSLSFRVRRWSTGHTLPPGGAEVIAPVVVEVEGDGSSGPVDNRVVEAEWEMLVAGATVKPGEGFERRRRTSDLADTRSLSGTLVRRISLKGIRGGDPETERLRKTERVAQAPKGQEVSDVKRSGASGTGRSEAGGAQKAGEKVPGVMGGDVPTKTLKLGAKKVELRSAFQVGGVQPDGTTAARSVRKVMPPKLGGEAEGREAVGAPNKPVIASVGKVPAREAGSRPSSGREPVKMVIGAKAVHAKGK